MIRPDKDWTLFLDRDGVINIEKVEDYINDWSEFQFYPGTVEAIVTLGKLFKKIVIVTNQKGIGKGVTKKEAVETIHHNLATCVREAGGHIDAFLYCPDTESSSPCRKPNPGMAFQAKILFPDIDFSKSLMVGNNLSDLHFGRNAGMHTAFVRTTKPELELPNGLSDMEAADLKGLAAMLNSAADEC